MSWLSDTFKSGAQALLGGVAGGVGSNLADQIVPPSYDTPFSQDEVLKQITLGNQQDLENQKTMYNFRLERMLSDGLTPYEAHGSPGAGAGGGTTGSGQTLGNAASKQNEIAAQNAQQRRSQMMAHTTELLKTKMQTDAQRDVADITAGVQTRGQDIQKEIADNVLSLNQRELEDIKIPQAAEQLGLTKQQLQSEINKTATSSPKFQKEMKQLSMGPANLLVELTLRDMGISLADDSFMKLSESQRKEFLDKLTALASTMYVETSAAKALGSGVANKVGDSIADWIASFFDTGEGIETTNAPPNPAQGAPGARVSEPILGRPGTYEGSKR